MSGQVADLGLALKHLLPAVHAGFVFNVFTPVADVSQLFILKDQRGPEIRGWSHRITVQ